MKLPLYINIILNLKSLTAFKQNQSPWNSLFIYKLLENDNFMAAEAFFVFQNLGLFCSIKVDLGLTRFFNLIKIAYLFQLHVEMAGWPKVTQNAFRGTWNE